MDNLKKMLMDEIGLYVDDKGNIIDQDTLQQVKFRNKNLKNDMSKSFRHNDIVFDPQTNLRQMESLLKYAINKDEMDIISYSSAYGKDGYSTCVIVTDDGVIESNKYKNPSLGYAENILKLYGNENTDLSEYDTTEE